MADTERRLSAVERHLRETASLQQQTDILLQEFIENVNRSSAKTDEFKVEMREFKDEMREFKEESRADRKKLSRAWGDLANKMGTVVEDIIAPGLPGVLRERFGVDPEEMLVRLRLRGKTQRDATREYDIVAVAPPYVFLNETKSNPRMEYVNEFLESLSDFFEWLPRYSHLRLVPIFSSLYLPQAVVDRLSEAGCYAMMLDDDHLEIVNFDAVAMVES